jgi:hypothetical protein
VRRFGNVRLMSRAARELHYDGRMVTGRHRSAGMLVAAIMAVAVLAFLASAHDARAGGGW